MQECSQECLTMWAVTENQLPVFGLQPQHVCPGRRVLNEYGVDDFDVACGLHTKNRGRGEETIRIGIRGRLVAWP